MPGIDKVRLDHSYQQYQQRTPVRKADGTKPQFPFDPEEKGVVYERSGTQTQETAKDPARTVQTEAAKDPARMEAARDVEAENAGKAYSAPAKDAAAEGSVTGWLAGLGRRFLSFLRGTWDVVWNGPAQDRGSEAAEQPGTVGQDNAPAEQTDAAGDMAEIAGEMRAEQLQQIIADHDMEQLVRFVTEDGAKKPARSTDLLTIYNRYGRVNYVDPSDRKKILEGNFNDIKL